MGFIDHSVSISDQIFDCIDYNVENQKSCRLGEKFAVFRQFRVVFENYALMTH